MKVNARPGGTKLGRGGCWESSVREAQPIPTSHLDFLWCLLISARRQAGAGLGLAQRQVPAWAWLRTIANDGNYVKK